MRTRIPFGAEPCGVVRPGESDAARRAGRARHSGRGRCLHPVEPGAGRGPCRVTGDEMRVLSGAGAVTTMPRRPGGQRRPMRRDKRQER